MKSILKVSLWVGLLIILSSNINIASSAPSFTDVSVSAIDHLPLQSLIILPEQVIGLQVAMVGCLRLGMRGSMARWLDNRWNSQSSI